MSSIAHCLRGALSASRPAGAALAFAVILLSRDPDILTHARFYAEDGWAFYPEAYDLGWRSLTIARVGYLELAERLVALASQAFPLTWAPTLFAAAGLTAQVLPAAFLVSARMERAWPSRWTRALFALAYLALPHMDEVFVNLTDVQWHLAIVAFLILVSRPPERWSGRLFDATALTLSGLSGPFAVLLAPVALWRLWEERDAKAAWRGLIILATASIQGAILAGSMHTRHAGPLGATPLGLAQILAIQVFLGPLLNTDALRAIAEWPPWSAGWAAASVCLGGIALGGIALRRGPPVLRHAGLFAGLLLAAALARPQISFSGEQWVEMANVGAGARYFEIPALAWLGVLFALARGRFTRPIALALLAMMTVGVSRDWNIHSDPPATFQRQARAFAAAPAGTRITFEVRPGGVMVLVKKP